MNHKFWKPFIMSGCIIAIMAFAMESPVSAQGNGEAELSKLADSNEIRLESQIAQMRKETALQKKANIAYGKLKATVSNEKKLGKKYAGAYIDDNNNLVVNLTTSDKQIQDEVLNKTGKENVLISQKQYSYEELLNAYHNIVNKMQSDEFEGKVSQVYVDEINNKVVVETPDLSIREKIENAVLDAGCINIQKSKGKAVATKTYLKPGGYIGLEEGTDMYSLTTDYSIGWRGWRINNAGNKTEGLVTAGHDVTIHKQAKTYGGGDYGKFVLKRFGGKLDMSFVQRTNKNYGETNTIKFSGSSLKGGYYVRSSSMAVGQKVYKVGMTTKLTTGKILSLNHSYTLEGYKEKFNDCVLASYKSDVGDSGGLVYMDANGEYRIAGNNVCKNVDRETKQFLSSIFIKAENIIKDVDIMPY